MSILPSDEAAAIVAHYLRALTQRAGLRWTEANDADMARLSSLLNAAGVEVDDVIPPYRPIDPPQLDTRVTQQFGAVEQQQWAEFHRWQAERAEEATTRRMMRR